MSKGQTDDTAYKRGYRCAGQRGPRHAGPASLLGHKNIQHTVRFTEPVAGSVQGLLAMISRGSTRSVERARHLSANLSCILCDGL